MAYNANKLLQIILTFNKIKTDDYVCFAKTKLILFGRWVIRWW
jgi:hypothetical protein